MFKSNFFKRTKSKILITVLLPLLTWFFYAMLLGESMGSCNSIDCINKVKVVAGGIGIVILVLPYIVLSQTSQSLIVVWVSLFLTMLYWYLLACLIVFVFNFLKRLIGGLGIFKSKFSKSFLIILAILIIGGVGCTIWKKNTDTKKIKKEEFVCSFQDEFKCEVEELVSRVVRTTTLYYHVDPSDPLPGEEPWYTAEHKLIDMGEKAVPVLIEIIKENRNVNSTDRSNRYNAIYILGRIGDKQAVDLLVAILKSPIENFEDRAYAAQALGMNKTTPKALDALKSVASNKDENSIVQQWAQEALNRKNNY